MAPRPPAPRIRSRVTQLAVAASGALILAGCTSPATGGAAATPGPAAGAEVVATTSIWGDITRQVVECAGTGLVTTLMPAGADPHDYAPSSQDMAAMVTADLVVANGLGLEEGFAESLEAARRDGATILELAPQLDPLPFGEDVDGGTGAPAAPEPTAGARDSAGADPHVWQDAARVARAAALIGAELTHQTSDPEHAECGTRLEAELMALDDQVATTLASVPPDRRILVTDHDALGYLAAAYGYTVAGTVVPGGSTLAEPSSADLAALAGTIRATGVPAIFANPANPQALVEALATEVGNIQVVELFVDSLGAPGSGADTYQGLMTTNAQRISSALAG